MADKTGIGDRMKSYYEDIYRIKIPRRTNVIIRVDGKAFHSLTRDVQKPFDEIFMDCMNKTAIALCQEIQGCKFAYTQSDEISLWLTDYDDIGTEAWFGGNLQKMCSISAALASVTFSANYGRSAYFDSRVFVVPELEEVVNYFIWRQQDASRNSINAVAQSLYSHKSLQGKNTNDLHEMIFNAGKNWNDYPVTQKRGTAFKKTGSGWKLDEPPIFTADRDFIRNAAAEGENRGEGV